jgi:hypothetical protein
MKYTYQELPQPENTASPCIQKGERIKEHEFIREFNFKLDTTKNDKEKQLALPPCNVQWQNKLPLRI